MTPDTVQAPPELGNQYDTDRVLRSYLRRVLPRDVHAAVRPGLRAMGDRAGHELYALQQRTLAEEPTLTQWGPWGDRVDHIEVTEVWERAEKIAARDGVVATAYEQAHGHHSRVHQMALAYLFIPSTDMYGCPLAMTDGAARTLLDRGRESLVETAVPHLTARDPSSFWTAGQWMTEVSGGSDVSNTRTTARPTDGTAWRLHGRKWFTSAITANVALALARPEDNPSGSKGVALFYVPIREDDGLADGIYVNRLKDKLGTRKLPTAELTLDGATAYPVTDELRHGTRALAPMLTVTRTWNAVTAAAYLRRGVALARDYARKRAAFGASLLDQPLHQNTLADLQAELEGMVHLAFRVAELLGRHEADTASESDRTLLRLLTPIAKLTTAKQAVSGTSEVVEAFGGAGYIEDTGVPPLLRDAQVLPIWEGTTNVLALDLLRTLGQGNDDALSALHDEFTRCRAAVDAPVLLEATQTALDLFQSTATWLRRAREGENAVLEGGARSLALRLGYALEVAYTARHAQWALRTKQDGRSAAAAEHLAERPLPPLPDPARPATEALARDEASSALFDRYGSSSPASNSGTAPQTESRESA
jgi:alkylation response protein AidB-like acyl-CoA dehydrogenase